MKWWVAIVLLAAISCMWIPSLLVDEWLLPLITFSLTLANATSLMMLFYHTAVTRYRNPLVMVIYMLLNSSLTVLHQCWQAQVAILFILIAIFLTHQVRRQNEPTRPAFQTTALITIASLFVRDMIWLVPVLWIIYIVQQSFGLRVFLASLISLTVCAIYFACGVYAGWWSNIYISLLNRVWLWSVLTPPTNIYIIICIAIGLWIVAGVIYRFNYDNNAMQNISIIFIILLAVTLPMMLYPVAELPLTTIAIFFLPLIALLSVYFCQRKSIARSILFIILITIPIFVYFLQTICLFT